MRKNLWKILMMAALGTGVALAQTSSPQSTSPSSTDQSAQQSTTSSAQSQSGQSATTTPSASLTQAQSQIQDALSKQLPSANVSVSTDPNNPNQLQLTGTVSSQSDKQRAEDIARSAAPNQTVTDNIKVSGSSSGESNPK